MKTISLLAAMFLTAALSGPAAEAGKIPFKGTMEASETYPLFGDPPLGFYANAEGTATSTRLGQFTVVYTFLVLFSDDVLQSPGSSIYTDANGDRFFTTAIGQGSDTPDPDVKSIVETHTITFGSGRYADAKGTFTVNRLVNIVTGATSGSFHGSIIVRGNH